LRQRVAEGVRLVPGPLRREAAPDVAERARLLVDERAAELHEAVEVDALQRRAEQRAHAPLHHRLHERAQLQAVAGGDDVQRPAHERDPHDEAAVDHLGELVGLEVLQPRPQPVVRADRVLRLQADEVLERVAHAQRLAPQQELAFEERAVERARAQDSLGPHIGAGGPERRDHGAVAWQYVGHRVREA
jgi:hypothetical protein